MKTPSFTDIMTIRRDEFGKHHSSKRFLHRFILFLYLIAWFGLGYMTLSTSGNMYFMFAMIALWISHLRYKAVRLENMALKHADPIEKIIKATYASTGTKLSPGQVASLWASTTLWAGDHFFVINDADAKEEVTIAYAVADR